MRHTFEIQDSEHKYEVQWYEDSTPCTTISRNVYGVDIIEALAKFIVSEPRVITIEKITKLS